MKTKDEYLDSVEKYRDAVIAATAPKGEPPTSEALERLAKAKAGCRPDAGFLLRLPDDKVAELNMGMLREALGGSRRG